MNEHKCCVCKKPITNGFYGVWGNTGTCSRKCEEVKENQPKHQGERDEDEITDER